MKSLPEEVRLAEILRGYAPLGIAFSGGADSTALAVFASRVLNTGDVILIHAETPLAPGRESQLVRETAKRYSIPLKTVFIDVLSDPAIRANDSMRCYHCKKRIMGSVLDELRSAGFRYLCDGANTDDFSDWRPGMRASAELGVRHRGKRRIRLMARRLGIGNWMMPASACAASRFPCGLPLEKTEIDRVMKAEQLLKEQFSVRDVRVRHLAGNIASIEVKPVHLRWIFRLEPGIRKKLLLLGFQHVEINRSGYKQGAMNHL